MKRLNALLIAGLTVITLASCSMQVLPEGSSYENYSVEEETSVSIASSNAQGSSNENNSTSVDPVSDVTYNISVQSLGEGGKKNITVTLTDSSGAPVATGVTARGGSVSLTAKEGEYKIVASDLPAGYYQTGEVKTSKGAADYTVNLQTKLITDATPESGSVFYKGDVLYDHTFNMVDGSTTSISAELAKHDVCIINFWGIKCGVCVQELPELNAYYEEMKDQVSLICVNSYSGDETEDIIEFISSNGYSVPSTKYDYTYSNEMRISGWPTTVVIDRYGRYAAGIIGFMTGVENFFHNMVDGCLGDSYVPQY